MMKQKVGDLSGTIWHLLNDNKELSIRSIGERTNEKEILIHLALGWLYREDKIFFTDKNNEIFVGLKKTIHEHYF